MACAAAKNFTSLLSARCFIGAGEAGFTTLAQPFLAEQYPPNKRATILACFGLALPAGSALGYLLGGLIGQHWGWRAAFMLAGVPGVFLALWAWMNLKDAAPKTVSTAPRLSAYWRLFTNKPFVWVCLAHAMITFVQGGLSAWMPTYLHRYWGMDVSSAGLTFGGLVVVCGAAGTYLGGKAADALLPHTGKAYFWMIGGGILLALPFAYGALYIPHLITALACMAAAMICIFLPMGPVAAALVALTEERVRSMAFAVNIFLIHALGDALSPLLIGKASDVWNLQTALFISCLALLPGGIFTALAARGKANS